MTDQPTTLAPCPFDGGPGLYARTERGDGYADFPNDPDRWAYHVQCATCAATGPWNKSNRERAARDWNGRAALEEPTP